jgi:hypothetical protein
MNVWSRLCRSASLLVAVGSLVVALGASAVVAAPAASAASNNCAAVTGWAVTVNSTYFFLDQGGGWISSSTEDASGQFGTVSLSVTATSFHAVNPYLPRYNGYTATFNGTVSGNCLVRGTWTSVNGANHGVFTAYPLNLAPAKPDISGDVTGSDGKPLAGIDIDVRNASGAVVTSAATDGTGHYQTTTLDPGAYSVAPATDPDLYTPSVVQVTLSNAPATANFSLAACSAPAVPRTPSLSSANEVTASRSGECKLDIAVTPQQGTTGLTLKGGGPTFLNGPYTCASGCIGVLIHVTHKGMDVANAKVYASVSDLAQGFPPYRKGSVPSGGYLCKVGFAHQCAPAPYHDLMGLVTNKSGNVRVLYWLPGLIHNETTTFSVTAEAHLCVPTKCELATGRQDQSISLSSHLVYTSQARLPPEQAAVLTEWAAPFGLNAWAASVTWVKALQTFATIISTSVALIAPEGAALLPLFEGVHNAHSLIEKFDSEDAKDQVRIGLVVMFLSDFKIHPNGLGVTRGSAETLDQLGSPFIDLLVGTDGEKSTGGLLYKFAQQLIASEKAQPTSSEAQEMTVNVYEVSYCPQDAEDCIPSSPGAGNYLYFELISRSLHFDTTVFPQVGEQGIVVPYSPSNWADAQQDLLG